MRRTAPPCSPVLAALAALALAAAPAFAVPGQIYVTSDASDLVRKYDGVSGLFQGVFSSSGAPSGQMSVHFGATNGRVLIGHTSGGVEERDVATGSLIKIYNPAGGWQWGALYGPTGEVYIGDWNTNDVRAYDPVTGAFTRIVCSGVISPTDMELGPDGNLYVCSWATGTVEVVDGVTGAFVSSIALPPTAVPNDIAFRPGNGAIYVTAMGTNKGYRIHPVTHIINGVFVGTGWNRPHGVAFSPTTGNLLAVDGVTGQVHEFDPLSLVELNAAFLVPTPGDKIVDLAFEPDPQATPAATTSWGRIKKLWR